MKNLLSILITLIFFTPTFAQYITPLSKSERAAMAQNDNGVEELVSLGFTADELPSSFSLEKYSIVRFQDGASCTGFAITGAVNIIYNYENDITRYSEQLVNRFDPYYFYCSIKEKNNKDCENCRCGTYIQDGLDVLVNYGAKKTALDPYLSCDLSLSKRDHRNMQYKTKLYDIDKYINLVKWEKINNEWYYSIDLDFVKLAITGGLPLVTAIYTPDNFDDLSMNYEPAKGETGPHAITVIGYDDNYMGGSFRILNSYGTDWGDNGYFWISYDDLVEQLAADVYLLWKEDGDFSSWTESTESKYFYKGKTKKGFYYEGPTKGEYFHGYGIYVGDDFSAMGNFEEGVFHGEWIILYDDDDGFWGWAMFDNGEIIDQEEWGFAGQENSLFLLNNTNDINIQDSEINLNQLEKIDEISTVEEKNNKFNYKNKNNYNKF